MARMGAWLLLALTFAPAVGVAAGAVHDRSAARAEALIRSVYVVATVASSGANGAFVANLTAADFVVKEGGKEREVIRAEAATAPMHIAMLIDDNGTGLFRYGIARFIDRGRTRAACRIAEAPVPDRVHAA